MWEFIGQYWLEVFLGAIVTGLTVACKKMYSLYKSEKNHQKTEEQKVFYGNLEKLIVEAGEKNREEERKLQNLMIEASSKSREEEKKLQKQINSLTVGVLSLQGRQFKQECREYLKPTREFTLEEFEHLQEEHEIYNSLGGNHDGDALFNLVCKKAGNILTDDK